MAFRMARPTRRSGSSFNQFRKRVPTDIVSIARGRRASVSLPSGDGADIVVSFSLGSEVKFSLQTSDPVLTKQRHAAASDQLERLFAAYRNGPRAILHKERLALAGIAYDEWAQSFEDAPGEPEIWQLVLEANNRAASSDEGVEKWFGETVDDLLARKGIVTDPESRKALIKEVARALNDAATKLKKNAEGDYRPDETAKRFPKWEAANAPLKRTSSAPNQGSRLTLTLLFERWQSHPDQKTISPSTVASYSAVFDRFRTFIVKRRGGEPDAAVLSDDDFREFINMRSEEDGVSVTTINRGDLAAINSVLNWCVQQGILAKNPAHKVKRKVRKATDGANRKRKTLNDTEARSILKAALEAPLAPTREDPKLVAAKRWVPWLMAYTGTRVGEVAQLRKSDVVRFDGHWAIAISMDAGTVKTKSTWHVPLHPHLIEQGFIDFVMGAQDGHLFLTPRPDLYRPDAKPSRTKDPRGILGPLQALKNKLAAFAKAAMPNADGPAPNHGWRHRFKAKAREHGIDQEVRDAFADHASASVAGEYGKDELYAAMVAALKKIPRYQVEM